MDSLQDRLLALELRVPEHLYANLDSLILKLKKEVAILFEKTPEYRQIYQMTGELKMWREIQSDDNRLDVPIQSSKGANDTPIKTNIHSLSIEEQKQYILAQHPQLIESYQQIQAIAAMDTSKFINYADSLQELPNFDDAKTDVELAKVEAAKLADKVHLMVVKNLIVFEKHLELITAENQFWGEAEERIRAANRRIAALEAEYLQQHKY